MRRPSREPSATRRRAGGACASNTSGILDPDADQRAHVEEAAVVQLLAARPASTPAGSAAGPAARRAAAPRSRARSGKRVVVVAQAVSSPPGRAVVATDSSPAARHSARAVTPRTGTARGVARGTPSRRRTSGVAAELGPSRSRSTTARALSRSGAGTAMWFGTMSDHERRGPRLVRPAASRVERGPATGLGVEPRVVDHVVAVLDPGAGCRIGDRNTCVTPSRRR